MFKARFKHCILHASNQIAKLCACKVVTGHHNDCNWMNECIYIPHIFFFHIVSRQFTILIEGDWTSACKFWKGVFFFHLNWYRHTANKPKALPFDAKCICSGEGTQLHWQKSEQKLRKAKWLGWYKHWISQSVLQTLILQISNKYQWH